LEHYFKIENSKFIFDMNDKIKQKILNILFPIECAGCGREDVWLCGDCLLKLPLNSLQGCFFCGRGNSTGATCPSCAVIYGLDGVFVCADYKNKIINELIKKFKYSFAHELGETMAAIAELNFKKLFDEKKFNLADFIVAPIPLHKKRYNWRGFNQAKIIAENFALKFNLEISRELIRVKHKTPQAKLGGVERRENIKDCFAWRGENLSDKNILLVDDVATTGSTLHEAARILKTAGAGKVWGLVIAK
jgi:competence protein ComFC